MRAVDATFPGARGPWREAISAHPPPARTQTLLAYATRQGRGA
jgi:hypothetical protein